MNRLAFLERIKAGGWEFRVARMDRAPDLWEAEVKREGKVRFYLGGARTSAEAREFVQHMVINASVTP